MWKNREARTIPDKLTLRSTRVPRWNTWRHHVSRRTITEKPAVPLRQPGGPAFPSRAGSRPRAPRPAPQGRSRTGPARPIPAPSHPQALTERGPRKGARQASRRQSRSGRRGAPESEFRVRGASGARRAAPAPAVLTAASSRYTSGYWKACMAGRGAERREEEEERRGRGCEAATRAAAAGSERAARPRRSGAAIRPALSGDGRRWTKAAAPSVGGRRAGCPRGAQLRVRRGPLRASSSLCLFVIGILVLENSQFFFEVT